MPFIPEEKLDQVLEQVTDLTEAVHIQRQAIEALGGILNIHGQWLAKIHDAVSQKGGGDTLAELLRSLVEADANHAKVLQTVLKTVQSKAG